MGRQVKYLGVFFVSSVIAFQWIFLSMLQDQFITIFHPWFIPFVIWNIIFISLVILIFVIYQHIYTKVIQNSLVHLNHISKQMSFMQFDVEEKRMPILEFQELQTQLIYLARRIEDSLSNLKILNSYISHEVKNSISILHAKIQLGADKEELISSIHNTLSGIENILALSEVKSSSITEKVDLSLISACVVDDFIKKYPQIELIIEESVSEVYGKQHLLYCAISNLVDNAIKYGNQKPIIVTVSEKYNTVSVCIEDQGIGIPQKSLDKIFEVNYRMASLKKDSYGVGLSLVKNVVEVSGGAIWVESELSKGTKFTVVFPSVKV